MSLTVKEIKDRPTTGVIHNKIPFYSSLQICGLFSDSFFTCHFDETWTLGTWNMEHLFSHSFFTCHFDETWTDYEAELFAVFVQLHH